MPARASVEVDCRVLPGTTEADLERELREALGDDLPYELECLEPLDRRRHARRSTRRSTTLCQRFLDDADPGAILLPMICTGFTDSHYLREAWGTVAYGFWPIRHDAGRGRTTPASTTSTSASTSTTSAVATRFHVEALPGDRRGSGGSGWWVAFRPWRGAGPALADCAVRGAGTGGG